MKKSYTNETIYNSITTNKEFIFHVGAHKTGSTFLQKMCFPNLEEVYFVNKKDVGLIHILKSAIFWENPLALDCKKLRNTIFNRLKNVKENKILFSSEGLFGSAYNGYYNNQNATEIIRKVFRHAKIIVVFRRQDSFVESLYRQSLREYQSIPINRFIGFNQNISGEFKRRIHKFEHGVDIPSLDWSIYIKNYVSSFGKKNVLVLPHELLSKDKSIFFNILSEFLSIKPIQLDKNQIYNKGYSRFSAKLAYILNPLIRTSTNRFGFLIENPFSGYFSKRKNKNQVNNFLANISSKLNLNYFLEKVVDRYLIRDNQNLLKPFIKMQILNLHSNNNIELQKFVDVDLKEFGYY